MNVFRLLTALSTGIEETGRPSSEADENLEIPLNDAGFDRRR